MAIEIVADTEEFPPGSPEWLQTRKVGIGGSEAAKLVGIGGTPYEVWADKVNPSLEDSLADVEYVQWGKLLEAPVREEFARRTGIEVHSMTKMVRSVEHPFMLANVDGITGPYGEFDGVYEGKTTRFADQWTKNDDGSVNVPARYIIQGMHYLAVLGLERVHYACLIGGQELRIAEVEVNPNLIADLIEIEEAFWQSVVNREPPPVVAADVDRLKKRWLPELGKTIELSGTHHTNLKVRAAHKANIKSITEKVDQIDAELMAFMGDAEVATFNGEPVITWRQDKQGRLDSKALLEAHPEIDADEFRKPPGRRFLPKEIA